MHLHTSLVVVLVAPIFTSAMPWAQSISSQPVSQSTHSPAFLQISQSSQSSQIFQHSQSAHSSIPSKPSQSAHSSTPSRPSQTAHSSEIPQSSQPAHPTKTSHPSHLSQQSHLCLTSAEARQVGELWTQLIGKFSKRLANHSLTEHYTDYSESALSLNKVCPQAPGQAPPLTAPVFTNRTQFEQGQGMQLAINSTILKTFPGCGSATMWYNMTGIGSGELPVIGVIAMDVVRAPHGNPYPYMISKTYSEFDVEAWISNLKDVNKCNSTSSAGS